MWVTFIYLENYFQTGASIYQAMSLAIGCFAELYVTTSTSVLRAAFALNDNIPAHCRPIGGNVLLQVLCAALYSTLLDVSTKSKNEIHDTSDSTCCELSPFNPYNRSTAATALAEAICSIDEDNKHTSQIDSFLLLVKDRWVFFIIILRLVTPARLWRIDVEKDFVWTAVAHESVDITLSCRLIVIVVFLKTTNFLP